MSMWTVPQQGARQWRLFLRHLLRPAIKVKCCGWQGKMHYNTGREIALRIPWMNTLISISPMLIWSLLQILLLKQDPIVGLCIHSKHLTWIHSCSHSPFFECQPTWSVHNNPQELEFQTKDSNNKNLKWSLRKNHVVRPYTFMTISSPVCRRQ